MPAKPRSTPLQARTRLPRAMWAASFVATAALLVLAGCAGLPASHPAHALPVNKLEQLRSEALRALPPEEQGEFRADELVEVTVLDPTLKLDVRYASSNNFMRAPVYPDARVFLQRPAAEAIVRASKALRAQGYGLVLFDGYRPWYVTQMFWDATPEEKRAFVADPALGSKHNRGSAIDLTLYDLRTGLEVTMPSGYDEYSERAHPDFAGGTSEQRAARDVLRRAMEAEGFTVNEREWWHYDYRDWQAYRIGNTMFKDL